jgi:CBS domain-containing protein
MDRQFIQISEIMSRKPVTVQLGSTVAKSAEVMAQYRVGSLVVMDREVIVGLVTAHDIIFKVVAQNKDPSSLLIDDVMSKSVISISPEKTVEDAMAIINENDIKQLPVVQRNQLVGFITMKDILRIEPTLMDIAIDTIRSEEHRRKEYLETIASRGGFVEVDELLDLNKSSDDSDED